MEKKWTKFPFFEIVWYNISERKNRKAGGSTRRGASSFCVGKLGKREEWRGKSETVRTSVRHAPKPPFAQGRLWALPRQWCPGRALDYAAMGPGRALDYAAMGPRRAPDYAPVEPRRALDYAPVGPRRALDYAPVGPLRALDYAIRKGDLEWTTWNSCSSRWSRR